MDLGDPPVMTSTLPELAKILERLGISREELAARARRAVREEVEEQLRTAKDRKAAWTLPDRFKEPKERAAAKKLRLERKVELDDDWQDHLDEGGLSILEMQPGAPDAASNDEDDEPTPTSLAEDDPTVENHDSGSKCELTDKAHALSSTLSKENGHDDEAEEKKKL